ncbi:hypothetical protein XM38_044550 [Halomicronema hongdechloris C2206]|uniref:Exo-alpha-sialidase n=1 Tax=Halomicronema hongdechloris C2206 TaxID=1641165 RepID=A0A1Z3HT51_9CYAN|nr:sialidase family protein [Halomicronema hongdechloris]ASC73488.1 hypothetical protein XM38_044550 [Halomicronema hongdechloris C2206]
MDGTWPMATARLGGLVLSALAASCAWSPSVTKTDFQGRQSPADTPDITWQTRREVAQGEAIRGPWQMNASEFRYVDDPTVALTATGTVGVAWANQAEQDIFLQIYEPDGQPRLSAPINVSRSPGIFSWLPKLIIHGEAAQNIYLLWQDIVFSGGSHGGEIFFARSTDGGQTFSQPLNLSNTRAGAGKGRLSAERWSNGSFALARGPQGALYAAWTEYEGNLRLSYSSDGGKRFSPPQTIVTAGEAGAPARGPTLAVAGDGTVFLAWAVGDDDNADIYVTRSNDLRRSFAPPQVVHDSNGHSDAPAIAIDSGGTLHLVYAESPRGRFRRYHIRYAQLPLGNARFSQPQNITGHHDQDFASVSFPEVALDGNDRLYVLWDLFSEGGHRPHGLGLTLSEDNGQTFSAPAIVPGTDDPNLGIHGSLQGLLMQKLAVAPTGIFTIVTSTFRARHSSHIWLLQGQLNATSPAPP